MDIIIFEGRVGKDAEMRYTPSGNPVTNFSVAVNRSYQKDGEWINRTMWVKVSCWGKLAEAMNNKVKKGMLVIVRGHLEPDYDTGNPKTWTGQDGTVHTSFDVTAESVQAFNVMKSEKREVAEENPYDEGDDERL